MTEDLIYCHYLQWVVILTALLEAVDTAKTLQCVGQPPTKKELLGSNVSSSAIEKL